MNPIPDGDIYFRPLNMIELGEEPEPAPPPGPAMFPPPGTDPPEDQAPEDQAPPEDAPPHPEDAGAARSLAPVFGDVAMRVATREATAAASAWRRCGGNRERFMAAVDEALSGGYMADAAAWFAPVVSSMAHLGGGCIATDVVLWDHRAQVREEILGIAGGEDVEKFAGATPARAGRLAAAMMRGV
jgi:hypothetical protein